MLKNHHSLYINQTCYQKNTFIATRNRNIFKRRLDSDLSAVSPICDNVGRIYWFPVVQVGAKTQSEFFPESDVSIYKAKTILSPTMSYGRYKLLAHQTPKENSNSKLNAVNYAHVFYVELKPDGKHSQAIQLVMLRFVMRWIKRGAYRWSAAQPMINSLNLDLEYWAIFTRNNRTRGEPFDMVDTL